MSEPTCGIAADTKLETPEGPLTMKGLANKPAPVFTLEGERVRFRMLKEPRLLAEAQPVLRIAFSNGSSARVAPGQLFFRKGMAATRAADLQPGDALVPLFSYREGYEYLDDLTQQATVSDAAFHVASVEAAGTADLYTFEVNVSGCFFLAAGVLCKA